MRIPPGVLNGSSIEHGYDANVDVSGILIERELFLPSGRA
jgi:hypothetical protein